MEEIYEDCGVCVYIRVHSAWVSVCRDWADDKSCPVHLDRLQVSAGCADPGRGIHLLRDHFWGRVFFFDVTILEVFIELVTILLVSRFGFWPRGMWDLCSPTRDQTQTPCLGR